MLFLSICPQRRMKRTTAGVQKTRCVTPQSLFQPMVMPSPIAATMERKKASSSQRASERKNENTRLPTPSTASIQNIQYCTHCGSAAT